MKGRRFGKVNVGKKIWKSKCIANPINTHILNEPI